jgi:hypothetical protein
MYDTNNFMPARMHFHRALVGGRVNAEYKSEHLHALDVCLEDEKIPQL